MAESFVAKLELAKKLKAAGYPQKTQYYSMARMFDGEHELLELTEDVYERYLSQEKDVISRPMTDELLEQLPQYVEADNYTYNLVIRPLTKTDIRAHYWSDVMNHRLGSGDTDKGALGEGPLPDSLAMLWLWLKENGYLIDRKDVAQWKS